MPAGGNGQGVDIDLESLHMTNTIFNVVDMDTSLNLPITLYSVELDTFSKLSRLAAAQTRVENVQLEDEEEEFDEYLWAIEDIGEVPSGKAAANDFRSIEKNCIECQYCLMEISVSYDMVFSNILSQVEGVEACR